MATDRPAPRARRPRHPSPKTPCRLRSESKPDDRRRRDKREHRSAQRPTRSTPDTTYPRTICCGAAFGSRILDRVKPVTPTANTTKATGSLTVATECRWDVRPGGPRCGGDRRAAARSAPPPPAGPPRQQCCTDYELRPIPVSSGNGEGKGMSAMKLRTHWPPSRLAAYMARSALPEQVVDRATRVGGGQRQPDARTYRQRNTVDHDRRVRMLQGLGAPPLVSPRWNLRSAPRIRRHRAVQRWPFPPREVVSRSGDPDE